MSAAEVEREDVRLRSNLLGQTTSVRIVPHSVRGSARGSLNLTAEPLLALAPEANERVILTITPRQPGRVRVAGMDLTYRHGWQYGTQAVGEHVVARFTEEDDSS